ncbi:sigma-70 family RNA polymerase sigma factor [Glaciibacter psychrotolerans]|uniref:RNA polymerase sigma factor (Sigma-70 family) n=1 Tax=Glaciibacter psychrotolerans TaxID=670054 RepID=A0A7Z0EDF3_9MICO|nr:sigma-70 family RNA polymerase sigma factor [Leifsonia psychrotolerans]NYJ19614.1 RNA polymerase sigma factor (sigma-70 family) [Leifsonia psychrotolerans]
MLLSTLPDAELREHALPDIRLATDATRARRALLLARTAKHNDARAAEVSMFEMRAAAEARQSPGNRYASRAHAEFIRRYEPLVAKIAGRYSSGTGPSHDELMQEGRLAVSTALASWNSNTASFVSYGATCITRELRRGTVAHSDRASRLSELTRNDDTGTETIRADVEAQALADSSVQSTEDAVISGELKRVVLAALDLLHETERSVVTGYYLPEAGGPTRAALATELGLSKIELANAEASALRKLRSVLLDATAY